MTIKTFEETNLPQDPVLKEAYDICKEAVEKIDRMLYENYFYLDASIEKRRKIINFPGPFECLKNCREKLNQEITQAEQVFDLPGVDLKEKLSASAFILIISAVNFSSALLAFTDYIEELGPENFSDLNISGKNSQVRAKKSEKKLLSLIKNAGFKEETIWEALQTPMINIDFSKAPTSLKILAADTISAMSDETISDLIKSKDNISAFNKCAKYIRKDEIPAVLHKKMMKTVKKVNALKPK